MIECKIVSPKKTILYKNLKSICLKTSSGEIQILPQHAQTFALLEEGNIVLTKIDGEKEVFPVKKGCFHFQNNSLLIVLEKEEKMLFSKITQVIKNLEQSSKN